MTAVHAATPGRGPAEAVTVVLAGVRRWRAGGAPPPLVRPAARRSLVARLAAAMDPSAAATGLGYPPPSAYPAVPMPLGASRAPAGLRGPLPGPVTPPPSSDFPALDRAVVRSRWVLGDEPGTGTRR